MGSGEKYLRIDNIKPLPVFMGDDLISMYLEKSLKGIRGVSEELKDYLDN